MKKSNWIILAVALVVSIFLLWLWYFLGLNKIDQPLDLLLSILWWAVIALAVFVIYRVEKARRQRVRTMYVGEKVFFNSEAGVVPYTDKENLVLLMRQTLEGLKYDFTKNDLPDLEQTPIDYVVHTSEFKIKEVEENQEGKSTTEEEKWEGDVVYAKPEDKKEREEKFFEDKEQLLQVIKSLPLPV